VNKIRKLQQKYLEVISEAAQSTPTSISITVDEALDNSPSFEWGEGYVIGFGQGVAEARPEWAQDIRIATRELVMALKEEREKLNESRTKIYKRAYRDGKGHKQKARRVHKAGKKAH
jgi:hypothetical protein